MSDVVEIYVTGSITDTLASYGVVLRSGRHQKEFSACYPVDLYSRSTVLMEGTITALKMVSRPCNITIVSSDTYEIHRDLLTTAYPHLLGVLKTLESVHTITWESWPAHKDLLYSQKIAEKAIGAYVLAEETARPCFGLIRKAMDVFNIGLEARIKVCKWLKKNEAGGDEWGDPVDISVVRERG